MKYILFTFKQNYKIILKVPIYWTTFCNTTFLIGRWERNGNEIEPQYGGKDRHLQRPVPYIGQRHCPVNGGHISTTSTYLLRGKFTPRRSSSGRASRFFSLHLFVSPPSRNERKYTKSFRRSKIISI